MKLKTSELTGAALDWAVLSLECALPAPFKSFPAVLNGTVRIFRPDIGAHSEPISPSTNWSQGGPIIEREGITVSKEDGCWSSYFRDNLFEDDGSEHWQTGPTPLIAACRCYVASKLGDTVDVPEELTNAK